MARRRRQNIECDRGRGIEGDVPPPAERQALRLAHPGERLFGRVGFDAVRRQSAKAENDGLVCRVALAGEGERAEERDRDRRDAINRAAGGKTAREGGGGLHRPDRVR